MKTFIFTTAYYSTTDLLTLQNFYERFKCDNCAGHIKTQRGINNFTKKMNSNMKVLQKLKGKPNVKYKRNISDIVLKTYGQWILLYVGNM